MAYVIDHCEGSAFFLKSLCPLEGLFLSQLGEKDLSQRGRAAKAFLDAAASFLLGKNSGYNPYGQGRPARLPATRPHITGWQSSVILTGGPPASAFPAPTSASSCAALRGV